jgi:hypothetical protein
MQVESELLRSLLAGGVRRNGEVHFSHNHVPLAMTGLDKSDNFIVTRNDYILGLLPNHVKDYKIALLLDYYSSDICSEYGYVYASGQYIVRIGSVRSGSIYHNVVNIDGKCFDYRGMLLPVGTYIDRVKSTLARYSETFSNEDFNRGMTRSTR